MERQEENDLGSGKVNPVHGGQRCGKAAEQKE